MGGEGGMVKGKGDHSSRLAKGEEREKGGIEQQYRKGKGRGRMDIIQCVGEG